MGTLFKNGTVINAGDTFPADVLVEGEKIVLLGQSIPEAGHKVIDAKGKYLMPGGIDVHTHLDFVIQPKGGSLHDGLADWHRKADPKAQIDYGFHLAITDLRPEVMEEIPSLVND